MMISIGYKHFIESGYIVEILNPNRLRATKMMHTAAESGMLINATSGRRIRSIIKLKSRHIVLSALGVETLKSRLGKSPVLPSAPRNIDILRLKQKKNDASESKPSEFENRRIELDRRHFSYTYYLPERRSGVERRSKNGKFQRERKIQ
jgi:regulator of extracellular matrix RemA (YlzA/DUF370 family)